MHCKFCNTALSSENVDAKRQVIVCPTCTATFSAQSAPDQPQPPDMTLPKGLQLEILAGGLKITRLWFEPVFIILLIFCAVWDFVALAVVIEMGRFGLLTPHLWVGAVFTYYALSKLINRTVIHVTPQQLTIRHKPLPYPGNKKVDPIILKQLYTQRRAHRQKNSVHYTYEVHMHAWDGRNEPLITRLTTPQQALYFEHQIESYLGIKDIPMTGELDDGLLRRQRVNWQGWKTVAHNTGLTFNTGKVLEAFRVHGRYRGYHLDMRPFREADNKLPSTHLQITLPYSPAASKQAPSEQTAMPPITPPEISSIFTPKGFTIEGLVQMRSHGNKITYRQKGIETNPRNLHLLFDTLCNLLDAYPKIILLGGEAVSTLLPVAADKEGLLQKVVRQPNQEKNHPLRAIAGQLLQEIAQRTATRLAPRADQLLCTRCLVHCSEHQVAMTSVNNLVYYGCRLCHQSNTFFTVNRVVAILDQQMPAQPAQHADTLRVNWLTHRAMFDFDSVEIVRATDEDIERFAVQAGNDTDPLRQSGYKKMGCRVSAACGLSPNSLRILQRTFGQVEVTTA